MRVLFRADASVEIGTGHVMRCATLADALHELGAEVAFACRTLPGDLLSWLQQKGYSTFTLNVKNEAVDEDVSATIQAWQGAQPIDWLVVDHYGLDAHWERSMRRHFGKILVIDDLANRPHDCDFLLDQNLLNAQSANYKALVPIHCQQLLGPQFALLRPEFRQARAQSLASHGRDAHHVSLDPHVSQTLLIFFGGSDPTQECFKALEALRLLPANQALQVDLVAGASNPQFAALEQLCQEFPQVRLHRQVSAMADLMSQADLTLGAGGTTSWERFCLGLPSIIIAVANNQVEISRNLAENGYQLYLGESSSVTPKAIAQALQQLINDPAQRLALSARGMELVDGLGVQRVATLMHEARQ